MCDRARLRAATSLQFLPPKAITASVMREDGGERPAYCLMAAYRTEADAVEALGALAATQAEVQAEPVAWLICRSAFRVSPDGQDAEGHEWLEEADEPGMEGSFPVYTAPQAQPADALDAWQAIGSLPTCDDLIWLYCQDTNTIDGPVAPHPMYEDSWTHWAYAQAPSTATIDAAMAAAQEGGNASAGKDDAA